MAQFGKILLRSNTTELKKIDNSFWWMIKSLITSLGGEISYFFLTKSLRISVDIHEKTGQTDA